ncbi:hypothetical protein [Amaricoccus tamworthensis]|uniref:hypothetical protein n=1 Tax=Amaricoccus tamworthensis TaxID=57002 RepID=UPI003C7ABB45
MENEDAPWSFISVPDLFNADYADLSGGQDASIAAVFGGNSVDYADGLVAAPNWTPGGPNAMNAALAQVWKTNTELMVNAAGGNPDLVAIAGDLAFSRWSWEQHDQNVEALFGGATLNETLHRASASFTSWQLKLWEEAGVNTIVAAIGDHEIGDNNWPAGQRTNAVPAMKEAFGEHMVDPLGLAATWNGVSTFAPQGSGQYDEGSYVYQNKNVLFLTVDVFKYSAGGGLANGGVEASVDGTHLQWIRNVLNAADADASVDHVVVQGHVPVLTPVNAVRSSRMTFEDGENSAFWQALQSHGSNNGGKVRAYLNGEVHATTTVVDDDSGIVQISHGANNMAELGNQTNPYFMTFEVTPDRIVGREFTIRNDNNNTSDRVWQGHLPSSQAVDTVVGGAVEIGTIEINVSSGSAVTTVTGNLEAPLSTSGHQTYVGGPGDDLHAAGLAGAGSAFFQNNRMFGNGGDDTLLGRAGDDTIFGGADDDTIDGGTGSDDLTGGPGNDVFRFATGDGSDVIRDFVKGQDTIEVGVGSFAALTITPSGGDALVSYQGGQIRVAGVAAGSLDAADFGFDVPDDPDDPPVDPPTNFPGLLTIDRNGNQVTVTATSRLNTAIFDGRIEADGFGFSNLQTQSFENNDSVAIVGGDIVFDMRVYNSPNNRDVFSFNVEANATLDVTGAFDVVIDSVPVDPGDPPDDPDDPPVDPPDDPDDPPVDPPTNFPGLLTIDRNGNQVTVTATSRLNTAIFDGRIETDGFGFSNLQTQSFENNDSVAIVGGDIVFDMRVYNSPNNRDVFSFNVDANATLDVTGAFDVVIDSVPVDPGDPPDDPDDPPVDPPDDPADPPVDPPDDPDDPPVDPPTNFPGLLTIDRDGNEVTVTATSRLNTAIFQGRIEADGFGFSNLQTQSFENNDSVSISGGDIVFNMRVYNSPGNRDVFSFNVDANATLDVTGAFDVVIDSVPVDPGDPPDDPDDPPVDPPDDPDDPPVDPPTNFPGLLTIDRNGDEVTVTATSRLNTAIFDGRIEADGFIFSDLQTQSFENNDSVSISGGDIVFDMRVYNSPGNRDVFTFNVDESADLDVTGAFDVLLV